MDENEFFREATLHICQNTGQAKIWMIWIFVQVNMIGGGHWHQYLYFALGVGEVSLAVLLLKE